MSSYIEANIKAIYLHPSQKVPVVFVADEQERVIIPMVIGFLEAQAILTAWQGIPMSRPVTVDLLRSIIEEDLGARLEKVVIDDVRGGAFIAKLILKRGESIIERDCRPSDALALALRTNSPIFLNRAVVDLIKPEQANAVAMLEYLRAEGDDSEEIFRF